MNRSIRIYCRLLEAVMAACLAVMVVLVFGNVFMRYALNSGFMVSEELSRWLFVWMTFLGAVVALRDNAHLGTDMLVGKLSPLGKRSCMGLSLLLMLYSLWLVFKGSWEQSVVNWQSTSAVMQISMGWFYASGLVFSALAAPILVMDLWNLLTGQTDDQHLVLIQESEDVVHRDVETSGKSR